MGLCHFSVEKCKTFPRDNEAQNLLLCFFVLVTIDLHTFQVKV